MASTTAEGLDHFAEEAQRNRLVFLLPFDGNKVKKLKQTKEEKLDIADDDLLEALVRAVSQDINDKAKSEDDIEEFVATAELVCSCCSLRST